MKINILVLFTAFSLSVAAQNSDDEIMKPINTLFEAFETRDSLLARQQFTENASLYALVKTNDSEGVILADINKFMSFIGDQKRPNVSEPLWNPIIQRDDRIATVWVQYAFYYQNKFSHCGIDSFQLVRNDNQWKILSIIDTRRNTDCDIPQNIKEKYQ